MNKKQIAGLYNTTEDKVSKAFTVIEVDHTQDDFSRDQVMELEQPLTWLNEKKFTVKQARELYQDQKLKAEQSNAMAENILVNLDPEILKTIDEQVQKNSPNLAGDVPHIVAQRKQLIMQALVMRIDRNLLGGFTPDALEKAFTEYQQQNLNVLPVGNVEVLPPSNSTKP